ncbi:MAG: GTPase HflX [Rhabdochlamydiaceae bacterium]|nr:GTPase HflX [Candidatus Amphrikana amoebophyrae]
MIHDELEEIRGDFDKLKTALLVGVYFSSSEKVLCQEHITELATLVETLSLEPVGSSLCPLKKYDSRTYIGSGKVEELAKLAEEIGADLIIFDDEISPNQQRNLEKVFKKPVLDRTEVILEIFAERAQTKEATLQVELAKIRYEMPRLKNMWTHFSRQRAGGLGGEGEKQIEIDKRILKMRLAKLEREIKEVRKQREQQRHKRMRNQVPTFAIVGYTNAGKSTLLNALTDADVLMEDKLFATLDTTTRQYTLPNNQHVLLVDTVGFIRKLPHTLVAAFKSTLEEVLYTDILIHVLDISHPMAKEHATETLKVLEELKANKKPMITVLNKMDSCPNPIIATRYKMEFQKTIVISAKEKRGFDDLFDMMMKEIATLRKVVTLKIPQSNYGLISELIEEGNLISSDYEENDVILEIEIPAELEHKTLAYTYANPV